MFPVPLRWGANANAISGGIWPLLVSTIITYSESLLSLIHWLFDDTA